MTSDFEKQPQSIIHGKDKSQPRLSRLAPLERIASSESLITFCLLSLVVLSTVWSLDRSRWVPGLRSLIPVALLGLVLGFMVFLVLLLTGVIG